MRAAYLDDLRSKFLLENSVLRMEYAEVRVLHLANKVCAQHMSFSTPLPAVVTMSHLCLDRGAFLDISSPPG